MPLKILIAEDDEDIAYQYAESLKSLGHGVFVTKDGEECLSAYRYGLMKSLENRSPFDVVVVDYAMPKKNGVELRVTSLILLPSILAISAKIDTGLLRNSTLVPNSSRSSKSRFP